MAITVSPGRCWSSNQSTTTSNLPRPASAPELVPRLPDRVEDRLVRLGWLGKGESLMLGPHDKPLSKTPLK